NSRASVLKTASTVGSRRSNGDWKKTVSASSMSTSSPVERMSMKNFGRSSIIFLYALVFPWRFVSRLTEKRDGS
ncbi:hypothetical protein LTR16_012280, partial [Cryomyces antarcticus]